jgi:hypothetical protein
MSNHFSAANLKFPEDDACLDLTDLFVFAVPDNPNRTVLTRLAYRPVPAAEQRGAFPTDFWFVRASVIGIGVR